MSHQEGALAEQGVASDVAEVLEQDAADEPEIETAEHGEVRGGDGRAGGQDPGEERDGHEPERQQQRSEHPTLGQLERRQRVDESQHEASASDQQDC